jgi:hypothetical protein
MILALGFILSLLALYAPKIMAYASIAFLFALGIFFAVHSIKKYFKKDHSVFAYLLKGLISIVIIVIMALLLFRRRERLKNLGTFLELSSKVIRPNLCSIYTQMIVLSLF